jgi:hypothetical protein
MIITKVFLLVAHYVAVTVSNMSRRERSWRGRIMKIFFRVTAIQDLILSSLNLLIDIVVSRIQSISCEGLNKVVLTFILEGNLVLLWHSL